MNKAHKTSKIANAVRRSIKRVKILTLLLTRPKGSEEPESVYEAWLADTRKDLRRAESVLGERNERLNVMRGIL